MHKLTKKIAGVSLFEILLVLLIMSMLTVAAIQYAKSQREKAADQAYGVKLYIYGQAVRDYVFDSQTLRSNMTMVGPSGTNPITDAGTSGMEITVEGVDWLKEDNAGLDPKGLPYLDEDFTFDIGMAPLKIAAGKNLNSLKFGDDAFETVITFEDPTQPATSAYKITINGGVLVNDSPGVDSQGNPLKAELKPALTQDAVKHANELYTSYEGAAAIYYEYAYIDPDDQTINQKALVVGSLSPLAKKGDAYLRIDGGNAMEADLDVGGNAVSNLKTLNFSGSGIVNGLNTLNFTNGAIFKGIKGPPSKIIATYTTSKTPTSANIKTVSMSGGICTLSEVGFFDNIQNNGTNKRCRLTYSQDQFGDLWTLMAYSSAGKEEVRCEALCFHYK